MKKINIAKTIHSETQNYFRQEKRFTANVDVYIYIHTHTHIKYHHPFLFSSVFASKYSFNDDFEKESFISYSTKKMIYCPQFFFRHISKKDDFSSF